MLNSKEKEVLFEKAYIPEHLVEYVCSISDAEPFFYEDYLYFLKQNHLIFIGYPLNRLFRATSPNDILREIILKHRIKSIAVIGERKPELKGDTLIENSDNYYVLDISSVSINRKLKNSLHRASRDITIEITRDFNSEHNRIIDEYLRMERFDSYTKYIFSKVPDYICKSTTSFIINAKAKDGSIVGFNILDLGSYRYAFYMFNFISKKMYVPGVSDLLMYEMIKIANREGKKFLNLGLGINKGIIFFKKKWGGKIFLNYQFTYKIIHKDTTSLLNKILSIIRRNF